MRTTLDIADDVLQVARERARREGRTAGAVISDLARTALTQPQRVRTEDEVDEFMGFEPFPADGRLITNELINRLREEDAY